MVIYLYPESLRKKNPRKYGGFIAEKGDVTRITNSAGESFNQVNQGRGSYSYTGKGGKLTSSMDIKPPQAQSVNVTVMPAQAAPQNDYALSPLRTRNLGLGGVGSDIVNFQNNRISSLMRNPSEPFTYINNEGETVRQVSADQAFKEGSLGISELAGIIKNAKNKAIKSDFFTGKNTIKETAFILGTERGNDLSGGGLLRMPKQKSLSKELSDTGSAFKIGYSSQPNSFLKVGSGLGFASKSLGSDLLNDYETINYSLSRELFEKPGITAKWQRYEPKLQRGVNNVTGTFIDIFTLGTNKYSEKKLKKIGINQNLNSDVSLITSGLLSGGRELVTTRPLDVGLAAAGGFGTGYLSKGLLINFPKLGGAFTKVGYGLGAVYAAGVGSEIVANPKRANVILGREFIKASIFSGGFGLGEKAFKVNPSEFYVVRTESSRIQNGKSFTDVIDSEVFTRYGARTYRTRAFGSEIGNQLSNKDFFRLKGRYAGYIYEDNKLSYLADLKSLGIGKAGSMGDNAVRFSTTDIFKAGSTNKNINPFKVKGGKIASYNVIDASMTNFLMEYNGLSVSQVKGIKTDLKYNVLDAYAGTTQENLKVNYPATTFKDGYQLVKFDNLYAGISGKQNINTFTKGFKISDVGITRGKNIDYGSLIRSLPKSKGSLFQIGKNQLPIQQSAQQSVLSDVKLITNQIVNQQTSKPFVIGKSNSISVQTSKTIQLPKLSVSTKAQSQTKLSNKQLFKPVLDQKINIGLKEILSSKSVIEQTPATRQKVNIISKSILETKSPPLLIVEPFTMKMPAFSFAPITGFGFFGGGGGGGSGGGFGKKFKLPRFRSKYFASVEASTLKIFGKKPGKGGLTLGIRPLLRGAKAW
jgi:hypothetical protein